MNTEKECQCITHSGPHWLHMDHITKRQNINELLRVSLDAARAGDWHNGERYIYEYGRAEQRRMAEKLLYMKEDEQYPYSLLGDVEDLQALALSIIVEIGVVIQHNIDAAKARKMSEMVQHALF